jgi:hypothetical protein
MGDEVHMDSVTQIAAVELVYITRTSANCDFDVVQYGLCIRPREGTVLYRTSPTKLGRGADMDKVCGSRYTGTKVKPQEHPKLKIPTNLGETSRGPRLWDSGNALNS